MRFSLDWIRQYAEVDESPVQLAHRLTMAGLAVDSLEEPAVIPDTVVVGRIKKAVQHPNADRLRLCTVDVGGDRDLSIVCGAPNARDGITVAVATVGSELPGGLRIKKAKLRGEVSEGMICSEIELGLGDDADGIMELEEFPLGTPFTQVLGERDVALDIDIPSNRGDCLSHVGLAREIAAITAAELRPPRFTLTESGTPAEDSFTVEIEDSADCPLFTAHVIRGITVGPSPAWLVHRLESVGQRSINNVVDVTNYVMLELGQPMHAFDLARIGTDKIRVRRGREGETITTLDGNERKVTPEVLLITDGERPIAAGGVMGGANTEVNDETRDILLEAAWFSPERVLRGSRQLRLDTDASLRFRRGIDPEGVATAARRAATLLAELGGGTVAPGRVEVRDDAHLRSASVSLRPARVEAVLGDPVSDSDIRARLESYGFAVETGDPWTVRVPSWRRDIFEECDLVEEVGRHQGYDAIGVRQYNASAVNAAIQPEEVRRREIRRVLTGLGFHEAITRTLVEPGKAARSGHDAARVEAAFFPLMDPPSREEEGLRVSLVPSLLDATGHNLRHGKADVRLFELGKTFSRQQGSGNGGGLPTEREWVGMAATGGNFTPSLENTSRHLDFSGFKGFVEALLAAFGIDGMEWRSYTGPDLVPQGAIEILGRRGGDAKAPESGDSLGFAWVADEAAASHWDLNRPVFVAGIHLEALPLDTGAPVRYREPSRFPSVRRDLALVVPQDRTQQEVRTWIREKAGAHLEALELFDFYRGKHIPEGHVGLGFSLTFRADERTLEEKEVDAAVEQVVAALGKQGISRRET